MPRSGSRPLPTARRHRRPHRLPLAIALALAAVSLHAERIPLRIFTIADGLSGDQIRALLQDRRGFLWIGTNTGLSRFDGRSFATFTQIDGLPSQEVNALLETRDGTLWIGTTGGLARLRPDRLGPRAFESLQNGELERPRNVRSLVEDSNGRVWIGTGTGLLRMTQPGEGGHLETIALGPGPASFISALTEGSGGEVWAGTEGGLYRILPGGRIVHHTLFGGVAGDAIHSLGWHGNALFMIVGQGLYLWRPPAASASGSAREQTLPLPGTMNAPILGTGEPPTFPTAAGTARFLDFRQPGQRLDGFFATHDGRLWMATGAGLRIWNGQELQALASEQGLPGDALRAWLEDREGNVWLGSVSRGLFRLSQEGLTGFDTGDGLAKDRIGAIVEDRAGHLLLRSGNTVYQFDQGRFRDVTPKVLAGIQPGWGWNQMFFQDGAGEYWFGTGRGVLRMPAATSLAELHDRAPRALYGPRDQVEGGIFRLWADRTGDLWVATQHPDGIVVRDHRTGTFLRLGSDSGLLAGLASAFAEDDSGNLWIGFYSGGLVRSRDHRHFTRLGAAEGVPSGQVSDLLVDRQHALWVATVPSGAFRFREPGSAQPHAEPFSGAHGASPVGITCLTEDRAGRILLGQGSGVERYDPRTGSIERWTTADGLTNNVTVVAHCDRAGAVWLGSLHGIARLNPGAEHLLAAPPVVVLGVRVNGQPLHLSPRGAAQLGSLHLNANSDRLEVDFAGVALARPQELLYETRFAGLDLGWSPPTRERTLTFPRLPSGSYAFEVRARYAGALVAGAIATLPLDVAPPVWQRAWFVALVAVALLAAAWTWHRLRLRRLVAAERLRTRIAADLHDDLGTSLAQVSILTELGRRQLANDPQRVGSLLGEIGETARELLDALGDTVWAVDPRQDDVASLVVRLERTARELLEPREVAVHVSTAGEMRSVHLLPERRRQLFLLFKEALHNAARHAGAGTVTMRFTRLKDRLEVEVRDDGVGLPDCPASDRADGGRGLPSMRQRARALGAELEIVSAQQQGTTIRCSAPLA